MRHIRTLPLLSEAALLLSLLVKTSASSTAQVPFNAQTQHGAYDPNLTHFNEAIKTVAVIGAGPSGLQIAAKLIEHNFTVRLFDRAPGPGGNWFYTDETPVRESYPDAPIGSYIDIPEKVPSVKYYRDGDDGKSLDERWREHWLPRPVWNSLTTNSPAVITELRDVPYESGQTWIISAHTIQNHVRAFASLRRLNVDDYPTPPPSSSSSPSSSPPITSYSTRVDRLVRSTNSTGGGRWTLTLRRYTRLEEPARIKATWWTESFDAVFVATGGYDTLHVPDIPGIIEWSKVKQPGRAKDEGGVGETYSIYHSVHYRRPERYKDKTILIIGPGTSGSEIARDIGPYAAKIYASTREKTPFEKLHPFKQRSIRRFPVDKTEWIPEVAKFGSIEGDGIKSSAITLVNGSVISGVDEVILATGYKRRNAFLYEELRNKTQPQLLDNPTKPLPPLDVFSGRFLRNLHWTGHYINDPTIAFTAARPWNLGPYQALAIAKVWEGTAFLPSEEEMRKQYNPLRFSGLWGTHPSEAFARQYVAWLNNESLKYGGRLVTPLPLSHREVFSYYANQEWVQGYISNRNFTEFEKLGKDDWDWLDAADEQLWDEGLDW